MENLIKKTILALFIVGIASCSCDYEYPDYSNAYPYYSVNYLSERIKQQTLNELEKHGFDIHQSYLTWRWNYSVTERDVNNNILYQGIPRDKSEKQIRLLAFNSQVHGSIMKDTRSHENCLIFSSINYELQMTNEGQITKELPNDNCFYTYKIYKGFFDIGIAESLGFELAEVKTFVTEKDKEQRELAHFQYDDQDDNLIVSIQGTEFIDISVDIYGWHKADKGYDNKVLIGKCLFKNIDIKKVNGTTINLSEFESYDIEKAYNFYVYAVDRSRVPVIEKCKELGYNIAEVKMFISEKDRNGDVLRTFEGSNEESIRAKDSAESIDVEVRIYGWKVEDKSYRNKMVAGSFWFKNIELEKVNNSTFELSTDVDYIFVPQN